MVKRFLLVSITILCCAQVYAETLYVSAGGYSSIQSAIDDANNFDTIIVSPNTYQENIDFLGKAVSLKSIDPNDPNVIAMTIIDGSNPVDPNIGSAVTFVNGEDSNAVLSGFTIMNGTGQSDPCGASWYWRGKNGGGVFCRGSSPTITKNIFTNCSAEYGGGAIYCHDQANPMIRQNTFVDNYAGWYGGAIFARLKCSPTISNNTFKKNRCKYLGGAVYLADQSYSKVTNNWFEENDCEVLHGGAIYCFVNSAPIIACNFFLANTCSGTNSNGATGAALLMEGNTTGKIINNLFTANVCINSSGGIITLAGGSSDTVANNIIYSNNDIGIFTLSGSSSIIRNNNAWNNTGGNYGGTISDQTGLNGNISADPQVGGELPLPFGIFELNPNSPCIDSGNNSVLPFWLTEDYDATDRLINSVVDMGPQEYNAIAVPQDYGTIQEAINAAQSGDEIIVSPGFYQENVDFLTKNIRLRSLDPFDANIVGQTIIDGNDQGSCIKILSGQNESTIVAGLRMQNGYAQFGGGVHVGYSVGPILMYNYIVNNTAYKPEGATTGGYGGGIDYRNNSYGKVCNNTIIDNYADSAGGGVHVGPSSSCRIEDNKIINNSTVGEGGGGIYTYSKTTAWIINNEITGNLALTANGGGIWQWDSTGGIIEGNLITNNTAVTSQPGTGDGVGGGIGVLKGTTVVKNNIVCGNKAYDGGGIWIQSEYTGKIVNNTVVGNVADSDGAGIGMAYSVYSSFINNIVANNGSGGGIYVKPHGAFPSEPNMINNNVWNNQNQNYAGDIDDLADVNGNISADPLFVDSGYWDNNDTPVDANDDYWVQGDYRIGYYSLCRDAGDSNDAPSTDFDGKPRPYFDAFDIGAYELQIYDLTVTGQVGFDDLKILLDEWLNEEPSLPADLNEDGKINFQDFALLTSNRSK